MNLVNLDAAFYPDPKEFPGPSRDLVQGTRGGMEEVVGTKTAAAIETDFLAHYQQTQPQGRPEGGLTIEEMARAAKVSHGTIRRWLGTQTGYKAILGTKQYASRKQVVTYYVKQ